MKVAARGSDDFVARIKPRPITPAEQRIPSLIDDLLRAQQAREQAAELSAAALCQGLTDGLGDVEDWYALLIGRLSALTPQTDFRAMAYEFDALADDVRDRVEAGEEVGIWDSYGRAACVVYG